MSVITFQGANTNIKFSNGGNVHFDSSIEKNYVNNNSHYHGSGRAGVIDYSNNN